MKKIFFLIASISSLAVLAGCNMPQKGQAITPTLSVTQAYQTVAARLTAAVSQAPSATTPPRPTDSSDAVDTSTPNGVTDTPVAPTNTPAPTAVCDRAAPGIPIDVTIPDDTKMQPGQAFTKVWRLQNVGNCTWTTEYKVELFSGSEMGAPTSVYLPREVPPGKSVDVSVDMVAPRSAGKYQGNWKLRNPDNQWFGIGPNGNSAFWVRIIVLSPPSATPTPATPTPTPTATQDVQASAEVTLAPGEKFDLDNGQVDSKQGEDISYQTNDEGRHLLVPLGNTVMGIFGEDQPNFADCQSEAMGPASFVLEDMDQNVYLCYRTNLGLPGWARLTNFDRDTYALTLEILTWALP